MNRGTFALVTFLVTAIITSTGVAQTAPELLVSHAGVNGSGNHEWLVEINPASPPNAVAVELAFSVTGSTIVNAAVNEADWNTPLGNPGMNPFTGTVTDGLYIDGTNLYLFASYGSEFGGAGPYPAFPVELLSIETLGSGLTTLSWGEEASPDPTKGDIIAQGATNFRDYSGSITVPEPTSLLLIAGVMACGVACSRRGLC